MLPTREPRQFPPGEEVASSAAKIVVREFLSRYRGSSKDPEQQGGPTYFYMPEPSRAGRWVFEHVELGRHKTLLIFFEKRRILCRITPQELRASLPTGPKDRRTFYVFPNDLSWCIAYPSDTDRNDEDTVLLSGDTSIFGLR